MVSLRSRCSTAIEMHPIRCQKTMEIGFHYRTTQCSASVSSYNQPVQRIYGTKRILNYHAWERNWRVFAFSGDAALKILGSFVAMRGNSICASCREFSALVGYRN